MAKGVPTGGSGGTEISSIRDEGKKSQTPGRQGAGNEQGKDPGPEVWRSGSRRSRDRQQDPAEEGGDADPSVTRSSSQSTSFRGFPCSLHGLHALWNPPAEVSQFHLKLLGAGLD